MSFNQSRSDKSETQNRKSGRSLSSNQPRGSSGAYGKGSGGPAPSPSISSNRSSKKSNNNAQGGQSRASVPVVNSSDGNASTLRRAPNGAHVQPQVHGASDAPTTSSAAKQTEPLAAQRSSRGVPKAPTSQHASVSTDSRATTTPTKPLGDASKGFAFQFGSLTPGFVNGMQIPARTSSAPPNLDEQKRDQMRHESFRAAPTFPVPSVPKQQLPRKDPGDADQHNTRETHPVPKVKKEVSPTPSANQTQKPSGLPMTGIPIPIPFHQSPVSMPFGGPNQQMQSQGVTANSLQMPMQLPLPIGSAPPVQQPVFVPGIQPHPMQHQGIMHQGQNLSFTTQMAQLAPQLSNLGIGMGPQYPQQQGGKFSGPPRKTPVKITNPKTHEEVKFEKRIDGYSDGGSSGMRPHPNVPTQSQPIPSFAASHPINYYPAPYNTNNLYFPTPSSLPLTSGQMAPNNQAPRFNYPSSQAPQNVTIVNPSALNSLPLNKSGTHMHGILEPPNAEHARDIQSLVSSALSGTTHVTVRPPTGSVGEKVDSSSNNSSVVEKGEMPKSSGPYREARLSYSSEDADICTDRSLWKSVPGGDTISVAAESLATTDPPAGTVAAVSVEGQVSTSSSSSTVSSQSVPVTVSAEFRRKETISRSNSMRDQQKKPVRKGFPLSQHQFAGQSIPPTSSLPSQTSEPVVSSESASESVESSTTLAPQVTNKDVPEATEESLSATRVTTTDISVVKAERIAERSPSISSEISGAETSPDTSVHRLDGSSVHDKQVECDSIPTAEQGAKSLSEGRKQDANSSEVSSELNSLESVEFDKQLQQEFIHEPAATSSVTPPLDTPRGEMDEEGIFHTEHDTVGDKVVEGSFEKSGMDASLSRGDSTTNDEVLSSRSDNLHQQSARSLAIDDSKHEGGSVESFAGGGSIENLGVAGVSVPAGSKDKPLPELSRSKSTAARGKKKLRECLQKADAAGTTSDLYMAYKGPEEKKEITVSSEVTESEVTESTTISINSEQVPPDVAVREGVEIEKDGETKAEPDDWEDAADISKPKLETSDNEELVHGGVMHHDKDGNGNLVKKYSRDFLLKFAEQFTDVPGNFKITADLAEVLMSPSVNVPQFVDRNSFPSPGRIIDRAGGGPRLDRRNSGMMEDERWSKLSSPYGPGRDLRPDLGFGPSSGFRPAQGNFGVLRNPRPQISVQYTGGILSGPMQSLGSQGGMPRNSPDADRWQRSVNFQHRGLIPSPQSQLVMMHKTEKRYEVGKVADEEQAKQRQLKGILNKLTPQNFEKLFEQVKAVNIDNAQTLRGVIAQIFDKALMEPTFCEMYANFCDHLSGELPDFIEDNQKITFKRLLLNKCQEEFERGEREQEEANKADEEGELKQSEEEREEKRIKARRRMLGNIRLIGELYKKRMLTERIMHECITKLLGQGQHQTPDEEGVEALCKLMSTIGEMIDHPKAKEHMDAYFEGMKNMSNNMKLSSRVRFMLKDAIDLRKNKWQQRRKVEGPKKIEEVHRDAAQERQAQTSRLNRGPSMNTSGRRGLPMDYAPRGSAMLSSPNSQMGSFRTLSTQARGFGSQDVRQEERPLFEARTLSVPLAQRSVGDEAITLGPQGGLARGMSIRGPPIMSPASLADMAPGGGDSRRITTGLNGYGSVSDRAYSPREDIIPRHMPDSFSVQAAYDQSAPQDRNLNYGGRDHRNSDHTFDRSVPTSPPGRGHGPASTQNTPTEKVWPEERLREKSKTAIKEFYSARDEKEVALCIKELNAPSFHPTLVSIWVTDSFERRDMERDLLGKLLVNLTKSRDATFSQTQLVKGFESVLETLDDTVNDAPKAPEYLGRILAEVISEDVVPLWDVGRLIREGGEEPGSLLSAGLAGDVLGNILEFIKLERGENVLNEIIMSSNLQLETFRPPDPLKSRILEKFI